MFCFLLLEWLNCTHVVVPTLIKVNNHLNQIYVESKIYRNLKN